jgi:hypothetical protein
MNERIREKIVELRLRGEETSKELALLFFRVENGFVCREPISVADYRNFYDAIDKVVPIGGFIECIYFYNKKSVLKNNTNPYLRIIYLIRSLGKYKRCRVFVQVPQKIDDFIKFYEDFEKMKTAARLK